MRSVWINGHYVNEPFDKRIKLYFFKELNKNIQEKLIKEFSVSTGNRNRNYVLIDLNPEYCEMARKRIDNTMGSLF